jgi:hypothetical protein
MLPDSGLSLSLEDGILVDIESPQTMRLYHLAAAVQLPLLIGAYNPFKGVTQANPHNDGESYLVKILYSF